MSVHKHIKKGSRQTWGTKIGIILAVAGSAVGLGNFLRFPVQAVLNGGGAFLIPYFVALLLVGIPLMWIEWTAGRYGGGFGHGTAPGIFHSMAQKSRFIKYFGVIGIFGPVIIFIYYIYIESWLLGYTFLSLTEKYASAVKAGEVKDFFFGYVNIANNKYFNGIGIAYFFFLITFAINFIIIYFGIRAGIEKVAKIAMPMLLILGIILMLRVITLGAPDPAKPAWNINNGFGFLWNPDFSKLGDPKVWLAAVGQILFTLSVGIGVILTYASYLKKEDDVVLSGLTSASTNEFAEIILGGSIVIPVAFAFFGPEQIVKITQAGTFGLGLMTMPLIFGKIPWGEIFAFCWFLLLFLAGITSSISLLQPAIAFCEDEFNLSRKKTVLIAGIIIFILCQPAIFFMKQGAIDELDFWAANFCLVVFALVETILFAWIFGIDKAWEEIHHGAQMKVPGFYKFIIKYITPLFLFAILVFWFIKEWWGIIIMKNVPPENHGVIIGIRIMLILFFILLAILVKIAWNKRKVKGV